MPTPPSPAFQTVVPERIWRLPYPIRYFGMEFDAHTTIVRVEHGGLFVHSPGPLWPETRATVGTLGPVTAVVAPSNFHHLYFRD